VVVTWNNVEQFNGNITGASTVQFDKTLNNPTQASVVITPVGSATYTAAFACPVGDLVTVKEIVVNFNGDVTLSTTVRYRWGVGYRLKPI